MNVCVVFVCYMFIKNILKLKKEVSIGSLLLELKEPRGRGRGKIVGIKTDEGHQDNMANWIDYSGLYGLTEAQDLQGSASCPLRIGCIC